jgi:hypothetical protein
LALWAWASAGPAAAAEQLWTFAELEEPHATDAVPGRFIYDPISGQSRPNARSARLGEEVRSLEIDPPEGADSFTLEAFVLPAGDPRGNRSIVWRSAGEEEGAECGLLSDFLRRWGQTYLGAGLRVVHAPGERRGLERFNAGYYLGSGRITGRSAWRHVALVYDAEAAQLTFYLDYFQTERRAVPDGTRFGGGPLLLGRGPAGAPLEGALDEVRLTWRALDPPRFLRARDDAVAGVSFRSRPTVLPPDSGYVDLKEAFGAVGDGTTDDTAAFRTAFKALANKQPLRHYTLYIPPGEYVLSDTVRWTRFLKVRGAGAERTVLRLVDNARGYDDPAEPKAVLGMGYSPWGEWGRGAGNVIGNYLWGITVDSGRGNPAAVALDHHSNNHGAVEDVVLRSGDGQGHIGLSFVRPWPGPALIKNVAIQGFDYGVKIGSQEYSMTLEQITLEGQRVAGIHVAANILAARKIISRNRVPAVVGKGGASMITLLDSSLTGGAAETPAVLTDGALYVRNLHTDGYGSAVVNRIERRAKGQPTQWVEHVIRGPDVPEFVGDAPICLRGEPQGSLKLPVEETPEVPWGDPLEEDDWINVERFADHVVEGDWAPALEAAMKAGASTVYLPKMVKVKRPVQLRGVRRLYGGRIAWAKGLGEGEPAVVFDEPDPKAVVEIFDTGIAGLRHASPATLVLRHTAPVPYENTPGCGKLFLENACGVGWRFEHPQRVWARQWNVEPSGERPGIFSRGATIWALGFKTEGDAVKLESVGGARTEILGGFVYPHRAIPGRRPAFLCKDSKLAVQYGLSVYRYNHKVQILDSRSGQVRELTGEKLKWSGSRARIDLYTTDPFALPE